MSKTSQGDRLNLLFVSQLHPWPLTNGAALRVYNLLDWLSRRHRVTLVVLAERGKTVDRSFPLWDRFEQVIAVARTTCAFERTRRFEHHPPLPDRLWALASSPLPSFVRRWESSELLAVLRELRAGPEFDLVWVERSYVAEMARTAGFRRILVDVDDLESVAYRRLLRRTRWYLSKPLHYAEWLKSHLYERVLLPRRFWRLLVCKETDRRFFGLLARPRNVFVLPNGVRAHPAADPAGEAPGEMLFVGDLAYPPNVDAMLFCAGEVFPRIRARHPGARLVMVGAGPVESIQRLHNGSDIVVAASVPDLEPYYARATVVVVPIRLGGGTRIKVLEALAHGKAVVATSVGAEGLNLRTGEDIEIADGPEAFADACVRLLGDATARRRLAANGRERVLAQYEWDAILGKCVEDVLRS